MIQLLSSLTFPLFFLSPPKNLPIWSMRPGAFFLRPSPEVPAVAILSVDLLSLGRRSARPANVLLSTALSPLWGHPSKLLNSLWCTRGGWAGLWRCGPLSPGQSLVIRWVCNSVSDSGLVPGILYSLCTLGVSHCPTLCSRRCHCSWPHLPRSCAVHNKACVCESCSSMQNSPQHNQTIVRVIHILYTNNLCWNDIYVPYDIFNLDFWFWNLLIYLNLKNQCSDIRQKQRYSKASTLFSLIDRGLYYLNTLKFSSHIFVIYTCFLICLQNFKTMTYLTINCSWFQIRSFPCGQKKRT